MRDIMSSRWKFVGMLCLLVLGTVLSMFAAHLSVGPNTPVDPNDPAPTPPPIHPRPTPVEARDWPVFRANQQRTGTTDEVAGPSRPVLLWRFSDSDLTAGDFASSPAVVGNRVYAGGADIGVFQRSGAFYCLDADTGRQIWRVETTQEVYSSPAVVGGRVYVGEGLHENTGSRLRCLNAANGRLIWDFQVKSHAEGSPSVIEGRVYFGAGDDGIYCLDAATGKEIWHFTGLHIDAAAVVQGGRVFVGSGYNNPTFCALDARTGKVLWKKQVDASVWGDPSVLGERVYLGTSHSSIGRPDPAKQGTVYCLDTRTGKELWTYKTGRGVSAALVAADGDVYCGSWDRSMYCLEAATGKLRWKSNLGSIIYSSPSIDGRHLYLGTNDGRLVSLDRHTGRQRWSISLAKWAPGAQILSSPAMVGGRLYVGTGANLFICVGSRD